MLSTELEREEWGMGVAEKLDPIFCTIGEQYLLMVDQGVDPCTAYKGVREACFSSTLHHPQPPGDTGHWPSSQAPC